MLVLKLSKLWNSMLGCYNIRPCRYGIGRILDFFHNFAEFDVYANLP